MSVGTYSLCTLKDVKQFYTMAGGKSPHTGKPEDDALLENLVDSMSTLFETYCDREFLTRSHTEYYDGVGSDTLSLNQYPVTSVSGIWDDSDWGWDSTTLIDSNEYRIKDSIAIVLKNLTFGDYSQNVKIIYTAGYSTTPADLKQACIEEVARAYKNRKGIDVLAKTAADGSVTRYTKDLMPSTLRVLNKYRKLYII